MKREFAIYSANKQGYLTEETGSYMWSSWAYDAQGFETLKGAERYIEAMGWQNTTSPYVRNGAYVVELTSN